MSSSSRRRRVRNAANSAYGTVVGAAGATGDAGPAAWIGASVLGPLRNALGGSDEANPDTPRGRKRAARRERRQARRGK